MTSFIGLIGHGLKHSISPLFQQAAFDHLGLDIRYEAWETEPLELENVLQKVRGPSILGANITVPHKEAVVSLMDEFDDLAPEIGAVNTIVNRGGRIEGYNTDAGGFLRALGREGGFDPAGRSAALLGAGGVAHAAGLALARAGVKSLIVTDIIEEKAHELVSALERSLRRGREQVPADFVIMGLGEIDRLYKDRLDLYQRAMRQVSQSIGDIIRDFGSDRDRLSRVARPVEARLKSLDSLKRKAYEKSIPIDQILDEITDIVGIRIVVNNLSDAYEVIERIKTSSKLQYDGSSYEDKIATPPESGYRAIHFVVHVDVEFKGTAYKIPCEIQVRTLLDATWATLLHQDIYKGRIPKIRVLSPDAPQFEEALSGCDLLVNCTPVGMKHSAGEGESPLEARLIPKRALVYDVVYNPIETPLLDDAKRAGASTLGGLAMLVYQGAAAFELWTGREAPLDIMVQAAKGALE